MERYIVNAFSNKHDNILYACKSRYFNLRTQCTRQSIIFSFFVPVTRLLRISHRVFFKDSIGMS